MVPCSCFESSSPSIFPCNHTTKQKDCGAPWEIWISSHPSRRGTRIIPQPLQSLYSSNILIPETPKQSLAVVTIKPTAGASRAHAPPAAAAQPRHWSFLCRSGVLPPALPAHPSQVLCLPTALSQLRTGCPPPPLSHRF